MRPDDPVEIPLEYEPRVAPVHLGEHKYTTPSRAIGELVANAFDAGADIVTVQISQNDLGGNESVKVVDNGRGMTPTAIRDRFVRVGVEPNNGTKANQAFARFGVGRFAAHRIGRTATWTTTAETRDRGRVRSILRSDAAKPGVVTLLEEAPTGNEAPTGTIVEIHDLIDAESASYFPSRLVADLVGQFCAFLIGHRERQLFVQETLLEVASHVDRQEIETIEGSEDVPEATLRHMVLDGPVDRSRFSSQVVYSAKGQTVAAEQPEFPVSPHYLALVECPYLEELVTTNREALKDLDPRFVGLREVVHERVETHQETLRASHTKQFLREARARSYYPFRGPPSSIISSAQRVVYDAVLVEVNERVNVEGMTQRQQAIVFRLLERVLENEDLVEVLSDVVELSDAQLKRFRDVLERTTLDSILRLAAEVSTRLEFVEHLHELVYGAARRALLERAHLHKILEPHGWLFGEAFHLATSDKSFRAVIARHRQLAGLPPVDDGALKGIEGIAQIPDLFLAADREYPQPPRHRHLLVEIKAPTVSLGKKELDQIQRYADVILESSEFDKTVVEWDLFLISSSVKPEIERRRKSPDRPFGMVEHIENMRIWAFQWSEVIERSKAELGLVRRHLEIKSQDTSIAEFLRREFPDVLAGLEERMSGTGGPASG